MATDALQGFLWEMSCSTTWYDKGGPGWKRDGLQKTINCGAHQDRFCNGYREALKLETQDIGLASNMTRTLRGNEMLGPYSANEQREEVN